ncbi:MAG: hypothetical protein HY465_04200 [Deltaproteobacteria bacterium]|nr:hypothetical protein [Deltaproteobacteria bacterium]
MSLHQQYTWKNFLKDNPEFKKKGVTRTSSEGTKAFEAAFKKHIKEYLKNRLETIEAEKKEARDRQGKLVKRRTTATKSKDWPKVRLLDKTIGRQDSWLANLTKQTERTKTLQKNF